MRSCVFFRSVSLRRSPGYPLGRRGGGGRAVALLLRSACAGCRQVGVSRGGFGPSAPFGRAYAVASDRFLYALCPPELLIIANKFAIIV